jgi:prepilin-type N-terminal cleavage/methylation domain-containing protein
MIKRVKGFTLIELLIVVAIIAILAAIAVPNFLEAQTRAKVSRVRSDLRTLATAMESYYVDCGAYPQQSSSIRTVYTLDGSGVFGVNDATSAADGALVLNMPTFRRKYNGNDRLMTLTTPQSYITSYLSDTFATTRGASFSYSRAVGVSAGWILWSFGPDGDENKGQAAGPGTISPAMFGGNIAVVNGRPPFVETTYYNPSVNNPTPSLTNNATYDPTNGTTSSGDVYRIKQ